MPSKEEIMKAMTGRVFLLDRGSADSMNKGDSRHLYMVLGIIAVPETEKVKVNCFHDLVAIEENGKLILMVGDPQKPEYDVNCDDPDLARCDASSILISGKWKI